MLILAACPGCASLRSSRPSLTPPSWHTKPVALADEGRPADTYADTIKSRKTELASARKDESRPRGDTRLQTRSTAPPPGATLPADPIPVALDPRARASDSVPSPGPPRAVAEAAPPAAAGAPPGASAADPMAAVRQIVTAARQQLDALSSYQVRLRRQERVGTALQPEEEVVLSIRRQPRAVRLEWPDGPNKGREVIYAARPQGNGMMHVNMPGNALLPRLTLPPDSPLAVKNSRHPITEAGLEDIVIRLEAVLRDADSGTVPVRARPRYEGVEPAGPERRPCHKIVRTTPTGETWTVCFDVQTHLPTVVQGQASGGELLERYAFRDFHGDVPELAAAQAFDPDARWGAGRGFLSRLARSAEPPAANPVR